MLISVDEGEKAQKTPVFRHFLPTTDQEVAGSTPAGYASHFASTPSVQQEEKFTRRSLGEVGTPAGYAILSPLTPREKMSTSTRVCSLRR